VTDPRGLGGGWTKPVKEVHRYATERAGEVVGDENMAVYGPEVWERE